MRDYMTSRQFVVLDRDGTIIFERHYLSDPGQVELIPGVADGLRLLLDGGLSLVLITNQSGIGRGLFNEATLDLIHRRLIDLLGAEGVCLSGIYYCPHTPVDDCRCRKPRIGMIERAASELGFDPECSFVIGDKSCDIELGRRVGATTLLVRTGYGSQVEAGIVAATDDIAPDYIVADLREASTVIGQLAAASEWRKPDAVM
jgi:D-glycero-D-manno-heptose 1,7-bisphosphate phosphatase